MTLDLPDELRRAAGPLPELDDATFSRLSRPRRRSGHAVLATTVVVLLVGAAGWLVPRTGSSNVQLAPGTGGTQGAPGTEPAAGGEPATSTASAATTESAENPEGAAAANDVDPIETPEPAQVAASVGEADWEVLAVGIPPNPSNVAQVVTQQGEVDRLWQTLEMEGSTPLLPPGRGALVRSIAGSCDSAAQVHGVEGLLTPDPAEVFAAVQFDAGCAELEVDGTAIGPPWTLYVIAIPLDVAERLAGAVAQTASVANFDWEVLAVAATPRYVLGHRVSDQDGVDTMWRMFSMQGPAPTLPAGQGALFVAVSGSCDDASQVRAVDPMVSAYNDTPGDDSVFGSVFAAVYFEASCAELLRIDPWNPQPRTLYVITVSLDVAESLDGPTAYIACGEAQAADSSPCIDYQDNAVAADDPVPGPP